MKYDIFISYSRHDSDVVNELVALLEQKGYSIWIDRDGIESGEDFKRVILKAIKESKMVLFFSSEHSNVSDWTAKEIGVAVKYKKHIIPILLDDSNFNEAVEFDLINLDYVDYSKRAIQTAMREKLLRTVRNRLGQGSREIERLEAERKKEAERARLEKERIEREEAERKAKEAAEREKLERERKKPKKGLWIAIGAVVVLALVLLLALSKRVSLDASGSYNGHGYVDLGLPSGTLWATCNVGASKPEGYGNYYAWGETKPKKEYSWDTYKYGKYDNLTKYNNPNTGLATVDLEPDDDAATANWGSNWKMPTEDQWRELAAFTTFKVTNRDGVKGILFRASNGNGLFLPAAGRDFDGSLRRDGCGWCYYWSSSRSYSPKEAFALKCIFDDESGRIYETESRWGYEEQFRYVGIPVRAVVFSK